jgi:hypothetical protein
MAIYGILIGVIRYKARTFMGRIRLGEVLHTNLKKKAKADGRTLEWHLDKAVEQYLTPGLVGSVYGVDVPMLPAKPNDNGLFFHKDILDIKEAFKKPDNNEPKYVPGGF